MPENSGNKLSTTEYIARKGIDVATAVITTVAVATTAYVVQVHGAEIAAKSKQLVRKTKTIFKKK